MSDKNSRALEIVGWYPPKVHQSKKSTYVDLYAWDPIRGCSRRKKYMCNRPKTQRERRAFAEELKLKLISELRSGWNPWIEESGQRQFAPISEVADRYLEWVEKTGRKKTQQSYSSRLHILMEWNAKRHRPAKYVCEMDELFWREFMDYILLDRDGSPRTRNNYRGWAASFCTFLMQRKYMEENPVDSIEKIKEPKKRRQPLSREQLRQMRAHLSEHDPHFLLACLFQYFTFVRPTELSHVRIRDISIKEQTLFVPGEVSKNGTDGKVGINRQLIAMMVDLGVFKMPGNWYLFGRGFKPSPTYARPDQFNKRWRKMTNALRWSTELQFYSLKDSGIRDLATKKGIVVARDQARHSDVATTNKYLQGREKLISEATKDFEGAFGD